MADQRDKPAGNGGGGKPPSDYLPGAAYQPSEDELLGKQAEVLKLLKEAGEAGIDRYNIPPHLGHYLPQLIHALRENYQIDTKPIIGGNNRRNARYVLITEPAADE